MDFYIVSAKEVVKMSSDVGRSKELMPLPDFGSLPSQLENYPWVNEDVAERSWFDRIPEEYRGHVQEWLVNQNYQYFRDEFENKDDFREKMAENWVRKYFLIKHLAEEAGFVPVSRGSRLDKDFDGPVVLLTKSASALLASEPAGELREMVYVKIDYRPGVLDNFDRSIRKFFVIDVEIGYKVNLSNGDSLSETILLFRRTNDVEGVGMTDLGDTVTQQFQMIDEQTITMKHAGEFEIIRVE